MLTAAPTTCPPDPRDPSVVAGGLHSGVAALVDRITHLSSEFPEWTFSGSDERSDIHDIGQYPAMMVPRMQGLLMDAAARALGAEPVVVDPFVGSGTTLVEAIRRGWAFSGRDINPLAILLCKTKATSFGGIDFDVVGHWVTQWLASDRSRKIDVEFAGSEKWFPRDTLEQLTRLRRMIRSHDDVRVRRLLWCVLSETIRTCSNSRPSTFKLHIRPHGQAACSGEQVLQRFKSNLSDTIGKVIREEEIRRKLPFPEPDLRVADANACLEFPRGNLLVTSPPYGDNVTTVPYGQFSFLPLQWIDFDDIQEGLSRDVVANTHSLDTLSLGGTKRGALESVDRCRERSPAFSSFLDNLRGLDMEPPKHRDAVQRATSFVRDLETAIARCCGGMEIPAFSLWTVGNRRICGIEFPLANILADIVSLSGGSLALQFDRRIPSKRMAVKNKIAPTMRREAVLIFTHAPVSPSHELGFHG